MSMRAGCGSPGGCTGCMWPPAAGSPACSATPSGQGGCGTPWTWTPEPCPSAGRSSGRPARGLVLVEPKSGAGRRTIKLPDPLRDALGAHRLAQAEQRLDAANGWESRGFVFCQPNCRPIAARRDWLDWKALLKAAGLRNARLHDARHTGATLLLQQGVPARVVMEILGHSQISLTLGTCSHVVPELAQEAAERMGDALWS